MSFSFEAQGAIRLNLKSQTFNPHNLLNRVMYLERPLEGSLETLMNRTLLTLVAVSVVALSHAQESHKLRYAVDVAKSLSVTTTSSTKMAFTGPIEQTMETKTTLVQSYKFEKGEEGWWKFNMAVTDFKLDGDAGMMGMGADPESMAAAVKKVKLFGEFNDMGKTRGVKMDGDDNLDMMTKGTFASISEYFNQVGFMSSHFPEEEVAVGAKWKSQIDMAKIMEANGGGFLSNAQGVLPIEYELLAFEDVNGTKTAKVQVFTDGKVTFDSQMGGGGTMSMTSKGTAWIDLATGLPVKSDTKMANNIDIGGQMNITQELSIVTTSEVK